MHTLEIDDEASGDVQNHGSSSVVGGAAILVRDATTRRLLEGLVIQLDLVPTILSDASYDSADPDLLAHCELLLVDDSIAQRTYASLKRGPRSEEINPALVAVRYSDSVGPASEDRSNTEGIDVVLTMPQDPGLLLAQLSVTLLAHRAFVRRYRSALDELHLNRRIFRSVTSGISVADASRPDMPLVYVNPAFEVMTGYSLEEVQGKNCRFLQAEERDQPSRGLIRQALDTGSEIVTIIKNYRKDGTFFWNELSLSPIRNRDGEVTHIVGIQKDVTSRVEFEAALRESEKLAAVGRLAASIAHEINNPLESVTNLIYLARHSEDRAEMRDYLDQADRELQRAAQITSQSLRFYRQSTRPQAVQFLAMVDSVIDLYQSKLLNVGLSVERKERRTEPVVCLESEVRQVVSNLIRNAIDAMAGRTGSGGRLLIRTREATEWRSSAVGVLLTIADNGAGIPPEVMKNLYKAFFTTKGVGGTGLGLWVSAGIIARHKGRLRVRSSHEPSKSWTVFQLFLPYQGIVAEPRQSA